MPRAHGKQPLSLGAPTAYEQWFDKCSSLLEDSLGLNALPPSIFRDDDYNLPQLNDDEGDDPAAPGSSIREEQPWSRPPWSPLIAAPQSKRSRLNKRAFSSASSTISSASSTMGDELAENAAAAAASGLTPRHRREFEAVRRLMIRTAVYSQMYVHFIQETAPTCSCIQAVEDRDDSWYHLLSVADDQFAAGEAFERAGKHADAVRVAHRLYTIDGQDRQRTERSHRMSIELREARAKARAVLSE